MTVCHPGGMTNQKRPPLSAAEKIQEASRAVQEFNRILTTSPRDNRRRMAARVVGAES